MHPAPNSCKAQSQRIMHFLSGECTGIAHFAEGLLYRRPGRETRQPTTTELESRSTCDYASARFCAQMLLSYQNTAEIKRAPKALYQQFQPAQSRADKIRNDFQDGHCKFEACTSLATEITIRCDYHFHMNMYCKEISMSKQALCTENESLNSTKYSHHYASRAF